MKGKTLVGFGLLVLAMGMSAFSGLRTTSWADDSQAGYRVIQVVNQDQFEGKWKQFKGDLKKQWGKFTDDDMLQIEGNYDKFEGKMQERYGDRREEVKRWTDEWFKKNRK
jgi:uncharacterized protein YjbJ (UPF0337 family)